MRNIHRKIKKVIFLLAVGFPVLLYGQTLSSESYVQDRLVKDLDGDGKMDTVYIEYFLANDTIHVNHSLIVCQLSSKQFQKSTSQGIRIDYWGFPEIRKGFTATKNGFEFHVDYTRDGIKGQFRYDKQAEKMQLIGMSRYQTGRAEGGGKGTSSVNLLTGDHVGDWLMYDYNLDKVLKIPTIKAKMYFGTIFLEDFSDNTISDYWMACDRFVYERKMEIIRANLIKSGYEAPKYEDSK